MIPTMRKLVFGIFCFSIFYEKKRKPQIHLFGASVKQRSGVDLFFESGVKKINMLISLFYRFDSVFWGRLS